MCNFNQLQNITSVVAKKASELLNNKLRSVILYGSYARGDFDSESDIDIMIIADIPNESCWKYNAALIELLTDLELENEVVISVQIACLDNFNKFKNVLPFYRNIESEGIKIAG